MGSRIAFSASCARPISTTIPLGSRASAKKAASTTKVAPWSAWAGPKTLPRNEWAIMIWSRTSTANNVIPHEVGRRFRARDRRRLGKARRFREQGYAGAGSGARENGPVETRALQVANHRADLARRRVVAVASNALGARALHGQLGWK